MRAQSVRRTAPGGMGDAGPQMSMGAPIDADFRAGAPGAYEIALTIEAVPFSAPQTAEWNPDNWTQAFAAAGYDNIRATRVRIGDPPTTNARSTNPALDLLSQIGGGTGTEHNVADVHYVVTVVIDSPPAEQQDASLNGLGVIQGWAGALIVLGIAALVFTAISYFTGKNVLIDGVKSVGTAAGGAVFELAKGVGGGVLLAGGALLLVLFLFKKSGGRARYKGFSIG